MKLHAVTRTAGRMACGGIGAVLVALLLCSAAPRAAFAYCCTCVFGDEGRQAADTQDPPDCESACTDTADSGACDSFCAGISLDCVQFFADDCDGSGSTSICDASDPGFCTCGQGMMCVDNACVVQNTAPAPALSSHGLELLMGALLLVGTVGMSRMRRRSVSTRR